MSQQEAEDSSSASSVSVSGTVNSDTAEPSAAEQRRARHRRVVKQSYYRKLDTLQGLRDTVQQLEKQFRGLTVNLGGADGQLTLTDTSEAVAFGPIRPMRSTSTRDHLMTMYARATLQKEALMRDNDRLQRQADKHALFESKLRAFVDEQVKQLHRNPPFAGLTRVNGDPPHAPRVSVDPFTSDECLEVAVASYREICAFLSKNTFLTSGVSAFGWRDRRTLKDGKLMFSLKKFHHGRDAEVLARRAFESCSYRLRQFYPSSMDMTHYLAQQVDENNTVLYRVMVSPDKRFATKALMLIAHFHTETGGAMIMRSLDPKRVREHKPETVTARKRGRREDASDDKDAGESATSFTSEQWVNVFTWILFDRAGSSGEHCTMDFGGIVAGNTVVDPEVWMIEVLPIALRLESDIVSPLFTLE